MITLKDKLSHLSYNQACKLLGARGKQLIMTGGKYDIDLFERVTFNSKRFRLDLGDTKVEIALDPMKPKRLKIDDPLDLDDGASYKEPQRLSEPERFVKPGVQTTPPRRIGGWFHLQPRLLHAAQRR